MADQTVVRRVALSLPGVRENRQRFSFFVEDKGKEKGLCWVWLERIHPKKARVPNPGFLGVRVADLLEKEALLAADPVKFFTEPHYNGYPAVLVRLAEVDEADLQKLLSDAWDCQAPRSLRESSDASLTKNSSAKKKPAKKKPIAERAAKRKPAVAAKKKTAGATKKPALAAKTLTATKKPAKKSPSRRAR